MNRSGTSRDGGLTRFGVTMKVRKNYVGIVYKQCNKVDKKYLLFRR